MVTPLPVHPQMADCSRNQRTGSGVIPPPAYSPQKVGANMSYIYLLQSVSSKRFYVGYTCDLNRRLREHNFGRSNYTKEKGPWDLVGYETFSDRKKARLYEITLKRSSRKMFLFKKRILNSRQVVG